MNKLQPMQCDFKHHSWFSEFTTPNEASCPTFQPFLQVVLPFGGWGHNSLSVSPGLDTAYWSLGYKVCSPVNLTNILKLYLNEMKIN